MTKAALYAGAAMVGLGVLYVLVKKRPGESMAGAAGRAAAVAVGDVAGGAVKGIGAVFGIPETNESQCQQDLAAGRTFAASFSCTAKAFAGGVFNSTSFNQAAQNDVRQIDRIIEREAALRHGENVVTDPTTGEQLAAYDAMGNRTY